MMLHKIWLCKQISIYDNDVIRLINNLQAEIIIPTIEELNKCIKYDDSGRHNYEFGKWSTDMRGPVEKFDKYLCSGIFKNQIYHTYLHYRDDRTSFYCDIEKL